MNYWRGCVPIRRRFWSWKLIRLGGGRCALSCSRCCEMVTAMQPRPLRICSVRDILQARADKRYRETAAAMRDWFDFVVVHADPAVATLAETYPLADALGARVFHSGYLQDAADLDRDSRDGYDEVIVSAGGGAVGFKLLETALAARALSGLRDRKWRLLAGGNLDATDFDALRNRAGDGVIVERNRADFAALLSRAAVSISQAGYNTVLDTVAANCRAVLVPFAQSGETEQTQRAQKFAALGRAVMLTEERLTAASLAAAVDDAARLDLLQCAAIDMDGAARMAAFITEKFVMNQ